MFKLSFEIIGTSVALITMKQVDDSWVEQDRTWLEAGELPELLSDGEAMRSVLGYGLLKLVQDRNSDLTKKAFDEMGIDANSEEAVKHRIDAYQKTFEFLAGGEWRVRKEPKAKGAQVDPVFAEAVAIMIERAGQEKPPIAAVTVKLQRLGAEERKALREKAKDIIQELKDEAKSMNLGELF